MDGYIDDELRPELLPTLRPTDAGTGPQVTELRSGSWLLGLGAVGNGLMDAPQSPCTPPLLPQGVTRFFSRLLQILRSPAWPQ